MLYASICESVVPGVPSASESLLAPRSRSAKGDRHLDDPEATLAHPPQQVDPEAVACEVTESISIFSSTGIL